MERAIDVLLEEIDEEVKRKMPTWLGALRVAYHTELQKKKKDYSSSDSMM